MTKSNFLISELATCNTMTITNFHIVVFLCFIIRFSNSFTSVYAYAYLPEMVKWLGYKEYEKGYYTGWIAASFFLGRGSFTFFWGWLSDKYDKKPIIVILLVFTGSFCLLFGFSHDFYSAVIIRFCDGAVTGYQAVVNAIIYEFSNNSNQGVASAIVMAGYGLGFSLGPLSAGYLASPVKKYPQSFNKNGIFAKYPYLLPNIIGFSLPLISAILVLIFLPTKIDYSYQKLNHKENSTSELIDHKDDIMETSLNASPEDIDNNEYNDVTHEKFTCINETFSVCENQVGRLSESSALKHESKDRRKILSKLLSHVKCNSLMTVIKIPNIFPVMVVNFLFWYGALGFWEIIPVGLSTSRQYGGLGFSSSYIGLLLGSTSLAGLLLQTAIVPRLEKRFGVIISFMIFNTSLSILTSLSGLLRLVHYPALWPLLYIDTVLIIMLVTGCVALLTIITSNSTDETSVGQVNGVAQTLASIAKALAPITGGTMLSASIVSEIGPPIDQSTVFVFYGLVLFICSVAIYLLPRRLNKQGK